MKRVKFKKIERGNYDFASVEFGDYRDSFTISNIKDESQLIEIIEGGVLLFSGSKDQLFDVLKGK